MRGELLRFGPFELDPAAEELRRSGLIVRLPRQPLRILLLLVERAGEVVSREEIQAAVWGGETYVDFEHGINSAIRQIRFAVGDNAETPKYIRTIPRRGYSFIAPVERVAKSGPDVPVAAEPPPPPAAPRRIARRTLAVSAITIVVLTAVLAIVTAARRTIGERKKEIAVQSFRRLGPPIAGIDERSFTEELRATIGSLPRKHVAVVAADADVVVGGTIRQADDGVRVIVTLADARTQTLIWSETFHRPQRRDGMAVEVAHRVMREIAGRYLPPPRREPLLASRVSPSALSLYRRARQLHARSQAYDWMRTKALYEAAVAEEPRFAEAWSGLSDVWSNQTLRGRTSERAHTAARAAECARRALALQPDNPEALSSLAVLAAQYEYDIAAAEELLRRAVAADPAHVDSRVNLAMVLAMRGQAEESLKEWAVARELDPVGFDLDYVEPLLYVFARRYEDARARYRDILAVDPRSHPALWGLMSTEMARGNWSEAVAAAKTLRPNLDRDVPATRAGFLELYRGFEEFVQEGRRQERFNDYFVAVYYAQRGDRDRAFELLHRAVDTRAPLLSYIMVDPRLESLRGDPRFTEVLDRLNLARPPQQTQVARGATPERR